MAGADVVDILRQGIEELGSVEAVGRLDELRLLCLIVHHLRKTSERLTYAAHLAGYIHVPHLVAVARTLTAFLLRAVLLDVCAVVHAVPHPQSHVLGYEQGLVGYALVVKVCGDVDKSGKLLVD